jgi:hypothetical protein
MKFFTVNDVPQTINVADYEAEIREERAAIMEYCGGLSRPDAEKKSRAIARKQLASEITFVLKPHWKGERPK